MLPPDTQVQKRTEKSVPICCVRNVVSVSVDVVVDANVNSDTTWQCTERLCEAACLCPVVALPGIPRKQHP